MQDFYDRLKKFKKDQSLSYGDLGGLINKNPDAFRQAVKRQSLSQLEKEKLGQYFGKELIQKEKTPQEDVRFEDLVAEKVYERIGPMLNGNTEKLLKAILNLQIQLDMVTNKQEKTQETVNTIEKKLH